MLSLLVDHYVTNTKLKDSIVRLSFFTFQGILGSILISDVIRILVGDFEQKENLQYAISGFIAVAPLLSSKLEVFGSGQNNLALGLGMTAGTFILSRSVDKK
jgi:hypothetical protein